MCTYIHTYLHAHTHIYIHTLAQLHSEIAAVPHTHTHTHTYNNASHANTGTNCHKDGLYPLHEQFQNDEPHTYTHSHEEKAVCTASLHGRVWK